MALLGRVGYLPGSAMHFLVCFLPEVQQLRYRKTLVSCADMSVPSFAEFLKSAVVKAGASARLQCTVDCQPKPAKITWCVYSSVFYCFVRFVFKISLYDNNVRAWLTNKS